MMLTVWDMTELDAGAALTIIVAHSFCQKSICLSNQNDGETF